MKLAHKVLASLSTLLAACLLHAADSKPIARVISIQDVEAADPAGYATWIAKYNELVKAKFGVENYVHIYVTQFDGEHSGAVRSVAVADSVATLTKINAWVQTDPEMQTLGERLRSVRKIDTRVLYQCVRFEGAAKNGSVYSTLALVSDETGYLKALDQLRAILDAHGMQDLKINVYRVLAGRTNYSHRISIGAPSMERLAAFLDFAATDASAAEWIASAAKYRTVVSNATAQEITK